MSQTTPRRWYQWHRSSVVVLAALVVLLLVLNLYPRQTEQPQDRVINGGDGWYYVGVPYQEYGWPCIWCRVPTGGNSFYRAVVFPSWTGQTVASGPYALRRPIDVPQSYMWLGLNLLVGGLLAALLAGLFEIRRRRRDNVRQFTLFDLITATALVAMYIGLHRHCAEPNYVIEELETDGSYVSAYWSGPTWLGSLRPVTVTEIVFHSEPSPRARRQIARWTELRQIELALPLENPDLSWLSRLTKLEHLDLSMTGAQVKHLAGLRQVQYLDLAQTNTTDADVAMLSSLQKLRHLNLAHTSITARCAPDLAKLQNLEFLSVEHTQFDADCAEQLVPLDRLREFQMGDTPAARFILEQVDRGHWSMASGKFGLWFQTEAGLWRLLWERGHPQYVQRQVNYALMKQPRDSRMHQDALQFLPQLMPREEAVPFLKPYLIDVIYGPPKNRQCGNPRVALLAASTWAAYGSDEELRQLFHVTLDRFVTSDPHWVARVCAEHPEYARPLLADFKSVLKHAPIDDNDLRTDIVAALAQCGPGAVDPLLTAIDSSSNQVRHQALASLSQLGVSDPRIPPALEALLVDPDDRIRQMAYDLLQKLKQQ